MTDRRVVVTGMGALTPVGLDVDTYWQALIEGRSGISQITKFDTEKFTSQIAGELKNFNPQDYGIDSKQQRKADDFILYSLAASDEAIKSSGLDMEKEDPYRCGVIIGSGIGGLQTIEKQHKRMLKRGPRRITPFLIPAMIIDMASGQVAIRHNLKGCNYAVVSACASSANSVGDAFRMIQYGDADVILAGGAENSISPMGLGGFCSARALSSQNDSPKTASRPFDKERDGFVMAEGAGILVLEELEHAKKRGADILAEVTGYGSSADAYHITAPAPTGESGVNAMEKALNDAGLNPEQMDYINAHGTSTPLNDKIETAVIKKVFGEYAKNIPISSTKSMVGHLLGAAGSVEIIASVKSINEGVIHPTINQKNPDPECDLDYVPNEAREAVVDSALSNSLGFGGHNCSIIVKKFTG